MNMTNFFKAVFNKTLLTAVGGVVALGLLAAATFSFAGSLTPPGAPANTFYSLTDLHNLASGTTTTEGTGGLPATPGTATGTMYTLTQVYDALLTQINIVASTTLLSGTTAFGKTGTVYPAGTLKTGQTDCWSVAGATTTCSATGQDGELQKGLAFSYTDNADGTVTDSMTGLMWQQATTTTRTWANALTYCNDNTPGLPGSGWRLPNVKELFSLVDFGISSNAKINLTYFPGTPTSGFWPATTFPGTGNQQLAMVVNFGNGDVNYNNKTVSFYVRCVRG
jgi:uncharacterized membrane protein